MCIMLLKIFNKIHVRVNLFAFCLHVLHLQTGSQTGSLIIINDKCIFLVVQIQFEFD